MSPGGFVPAFKIPAAARRPRQRLPSDLQVYLRGRYGTYRCSVCGAKRGTPHMPHCAPPRTLDRV
jgi:hypothetical protein